MSTGSQLIKLASGEQVPYSIQQRDVRYPRLTLNPDGTLAVIVPPRTPGHTLVTQQQDWITAEYQAQQSKLTDILDTYGALNEGFTLWGKSHQIHVETGHFDLDTSPDSIVVTVPESHSAFGYLRTKVHQALSVAVETIAKDFCTRIGRSYSKLAIRTQRTKWASCSNGDTLNFNLRCAFLPISHLRYLVAHEVAHLIEPDHNDRFWRLVESLVGECTSLREELQGLWYAVHHNSKWQQLVDASTSN